MYERYDIIRILKTIIFLKIMKKLLFAACLTVMAAAFVS